MGYYTNYAIQVIPKEMGYKNNEHYNIFDYVRYDELHDEMGEALAEINPNYFDIGYNLTEQIESEPMKWYRHDSDMIALSMKFPDFLFILSGWGEESGDIWKSYYLNGKSQCTEAQIIFEDCKFC